MATLEDLKGFATVGNIYVDNSYTAETTPATDPITGEALEFGVNAFTTLPGGTASAVPANGSAMFITNVDLGTSRLYNGRPEKTTLYDVYVSNVKSGDIYVMPRAAGEYTPDTGTLNVYVEDVTIASGGYHGFGATTGANFAGNYDVTIKNSTMQYLAVATGSAYGVDNGDAANHRFALINGDVNFTLSNLTVTSVAGVARGSIGSADEKAKVVGLVENSIFGNNFHILFNGVDSNGNSFNSWNDVDITISGSSFSGAFMMYPNQSSATRERNGDLTIHGDVKLKVTGSTMNGLVIGAGRSGTGWQRTGWVDGNFDFEISGSTTGVSFINKGSLGKAETQRTVTGKINNGSVVGNFVAYELRSDKASAVYADSAITVTDATIGKFTFLTGLDGSGGATVGVSDRLYGTQTLELTGSTAGDILSVAEGASQADATFDLSFHASETKSAVGAIGYWNTLTVDAGASVQAASIGNVSLVTLAQGANLSVGTFSDVDVLNVLGEYTAVSNTLVSGLTSFSAGSDIKSVQLNGVELEYGFMPGQYSLVGDKLVLHQGETVLVNSTFPGGGADVTYNEQVYKGYTTVAEAQASFTADKYLITVVPVDGGTIDADIVTKNYGVIVQGTSDSPISMEGYDFIIGDLTTKYDGATIIIENLSSVGTIAFGDLDALFVSGNGVEAETVDLRGGAIGDAEISFSNLTAKNVYLPSTKSMDGKLEIASGSIENIYNGPAGDGKLAVSLGKDTSVVKLYAEGKAISVGDATVGEYYAGLKDGGEVASIDFTASGNINTLVLGGEAKNTIGSVTAKFSGSGIQNVTVGGENDEITGNVDVELNGPVGVSNDNPFNGIKYGATLSAIDGGTDKVAGKATLNVTGHSKVDAITGFDAINVTGGTLNLTGSGIEGTADIVNRRTISAKEGAISAGSIDNTGVIAATNVTAAGAFTNAGEFRVDEITVGGTFDNSSVIYVTGSITVNGVFTNSGDIYASSGDNAAITL
ncbi:MAG: hypothetical protein IKC53_07405, partial [Lentisphaeria bacterium]|nr:hypothetical protein [Lentisphaeria bacterium]